MSGVARRVPGAMGLPGDWLVVDADDPGQERLREIADVLYCRRPRGLAEARALLRRHPGCALVVLAEAEAAVGGSRAECRQPVGESAGVLGTEGGEEGVGACVGVARDVRVTAFLCAEAEHLQGAGLPVDGARLLERP